MTPLLPVEDAQRRLLAEARPVARETVTLREAAGRWAVEGVVALRTQPAADLSAMDGYAIRFDDMPGPWQLIGESAAGRPFTGSIGAGETVRILTGAALPQGADSVLVQEEAAVDGIRIALDGEGPPTRGRNVRPRGLDFHEGTRIISAGERLTPARIALAATAGHGTLPVGRKVRVALVATGDELVQPGEAIAGLALPESNRAMLAAMLANLPVEILDLGIVPDRLDALSEAFRTASADLIVTTGGASVGDHDFVRPALEAAGGRIDFWRIALRPGKPTLAGWIGEAIVLGLPGNPVSAFVTTILFVRPLISALGGASHPLPRISHARLGEPLPANGARTDYLRAAHRDGLVHVAAIQDSSMLLTLARADCLVKREPHAPPAEAGDIVEIITLA